MKRTKSMKRSSVEYRGWRIDPVEAVQLGYRIPVRGSSFLTKPGKGRKLSGYELHGPDDRVKFVESLKAAYEYIDNYES